MACCPPCSTPQPSLFSPCQFAVAPLPNSPSNTKSSVPPIKFVTLSSSIPNGNSIITSFIHSLSILEL